MIVLQDESLKSVWEDANGKHWGTVLLCQVSIHGRI